MARSDEKNPGGDDGANGGDEPTDARFVNEQKEFIQSFFKRASEFTEELLRENEKLRFRAMQLEAEVASRPRPVSTGAEPAAAALRDLVSRIEELERERAELRSRFANVATDGSDFERRYKEIERENNNLANLYVASFQLHSTLDLAEVRKVIVEILLNLIGAKVFAVLLLDEKQGVLRPLATAGLAAGALPVLRPGEGVIGGAVLSGRSEMFDNYHGPVDIERPAFVTPLRIRDKIVGAIAVWEFLKQKPGIEDVDHELFNLLAAHAASALQGARLATELRDHAPPLWDAVDLFS